MEQRETQMKSFDFSMRSICSRSGMFFPDSTFCFLCVCFHLVISIIHGNLSWCSARKLNCLKRINSRCYAGVRDKELSKRTINIAAKVGAGQQRKRHKYVIDHTSLRGAAITHSCSWFALCDFSCELTVL